MTCENERKINEALEFWRKLQTSDSAAELLADKKSRFILSRVGAGTSGLLLENIRKSDLLLVLTRAPARSPCGRVIVCCPLRCDVGLSC